MTEALELPWPVGAWRGLLADAIEDRDELLSLLALDRPREPDDALARATSELALRVPRGYVARMRVGDPADPLLRQVLPLAAEAESVPGFGLDPLAEAASTTRGGLIRKYAGRVVLVAGRACAIHCRYCFRRHLGGERVVGEETEASALAEIEADHSIAEVILSGGDPLILPDRRLAHLGRRLGAIDHVERLRFHSRMPVVLPERVDAGLLEALAAFPRQRVVVVHANHAAELDDAVRVALSALGSTGATLFNQSVLLAGVNDDPDALAELSLALFAAGVLPYYLHLLDRVAGAAHFEVEEARARRLVGGLAARLPGYLVPRLARERPGAAAKIVL